MLSVDYKEKSNRVVLKILPIPPLNNRQNYDDREFPVFRGFTVYNNTHIVLFNKILKKVKINLKWTDFVKNCVLIIILWTQDVIKK